MNWGVGTKNVQFVVMYVCGGHAAFQGSEIEQTGMRGLGCITGVGWGRVEQSG